MDGSRLMVQVAAVATVVAIVCTVGGCKSKSSEEHAPPPPGPETPVGPRVDATPPPPPIGLEVKHPEAAATETALRDTLVDLGLVANADAAALGTVALDCRAVPGTYYNGGARWTRHACDVTIRDKAGATRLAWRLLGRDGGMMESGDLEQASSSAFVSSVEVRLLPQLARAVLEADLTVREPIGDLEGAVGVLARLVAPAQLPAAYEEAGDAGATILHAVGERGDAAQLAALRADDQSLPDTIGSDDADPARALAFEAAAAMAAFDDSPMLPVQLTISMKARSKSPLVDVRSHLAARFVAAGLDPGGADPVARIDVKCREKAGPTFESYQLGQVTRSTWTRIICVMKVAPRQGKARSLTIDAGNPVHINGDIDDASRTHFFRSHGLAVLPEVAAVALGRARRAPVVASLAVGFAGEQRVAPLDELLKPYAAKLSPALLACLAVARRKFDAASAHGDAAIPALWALLTSEWGTAETTQLFDLGGRRAEDVVRQRLPAVKALASIGGPRAGVLAGLVARALPVDEEGEDLIREQSGMGFGLHSATYHPGPEEGRLLASLLATVAASDAPGGGEVQARFAADKRRAVREAATGR